MVMRGAVCLNRARTVLRRGASGDGRYLLQAYVIPNKLIRFFKGCYTSCLKVGDAPIPCGESCQCRQAISKKRKINKKTLDKTEIAPIIARTHYNVYLVDIGGRNDRINGTY